MNECTQKLLEQSTNHILGVPVVDQKKFAELIVRECCEVAHCNFHVDGLTLGSILKEHFGVKE